MLDFSDQPYRYFPPRRFAPTAWLIGVYNRMRYLPQTKRIMDIHVSGFDRVRNVRRETDRLIFLPNHPSHSDPEVFFEALRQMRQTSLTMAAYDLFLRGRLNQWVLQRTGAFSVDREGSDPKAMAQSRKTLERGRHALTIFPEGNVYLQNDQVTPFHEGAAMLGLRSAKDLAKDGYRVLAVPVSLKMTYIENVREQADAVLSQLEQAVDATVDQAAIDDVPSTATTINSDPDFSHASARLRRIGIAALHRNMRHRGLDVKADRSPAGLIAYIDEAVEQLLNQLESKTGITPREHDTPIDRIRKARRVIHQVRIDPDRSHDHAAAATWADEAMLAFRVTSYTPRYVQTDPTLDRYAETVEKLHEDIYSRTMKPIGPRHAYVHFNEPIDLTDYLDSFNIKARVAVRELTENVEKKVQRGVDDLNANNPHVGGERMA